MPKKIKALPAATLTLPDVEALVAKVANLNMTLTQIKADMKEKNRAMDAEIAPIRAPFIAELERLDGTVHALETSISATIDQIEAWALVNPDRFEKKRSLDLVAGTIGFRFTPPRVETLRGWTLARCALALRRLRWGKPFLKPAVIDRDALLRDRENLLSRPERLAAIGVRITQDDVFYVEPKQEGTDTLGGRIAA